MLNRKTADVVLFHALFLGLLVPDCAIAASLPSGGRYIAGSGSFAASSRGLTVGQTSATGIIDWNSFSIGKNSNVTFDNGSGATLNRVSGGNLARIAGSLNATGTVYLIDPEGVIVSGTGKVVTGGGFVASTAMPGSDNKQTGHVAMAGSISAGGNVRLEGDAVRATGSVTVNRGGHIWLTSSGTTSVSGTLSAADGSVETSGRKLAIAGSVTSGKWLVDPTNLTVDSTAATTIDNSLDAGTNVVLKTTATGASGPGNKTSGPGDITIDAPLTWSSGMLTLNSYHSIFIDAALAASGTAGLIFKTDDGGTGGTYSFEGGDATFAATSEKLAINGARYKLIRSANVLQKINNGLTGHYALAKSIGLANQTAWVPLGTDGHGDISNSGNGFTGTFEGLGNTVSKLSVDTYAVPYSGLFGVSGGTIRDLGVLGGRITGAGAVGALVGYNRGIIVAAYETATVRGTPGLARSEIGGLVGTNSGAIDASYTVGFVHGYEQTGGLVGYNNGGTITNSYSTGTVTGYADVGGLIGQLDGGSVGDSYATGIVELPHDMTGGIIGAVTGGTVTDSYFDNATETAGESDATGLTPAQFQSGLPTGFDPTIWGENSSIDGGFPYLLALTSSY